MEKWYGWVKVSEGLYESYEVMTQVIRALGHNACYKIKVLCESQLGKRGLYPSISQKGSYDVIRAMTDFIAYADGRNDLIEDSHCEMICGRSEI